MEKSRLVNFVAKVMEESGFKVYKNFQTSRHIIDIYGVLPSILGDIGIVVAVKNYDERWEVGLDVLKEMEMVAKTLKASKIVVVSSSYFTDNAVNYAGRRNIKLIDKDGLMSLAKKFSTQSFEAEEPGNEYETEEYGEDEEEDVFVAPQRSSARSFFSGPKKSLSKSGKDKPMNRSLGPTLRAILSNTIALIIIVLLISTLITYIIGLNDKNTALIGIAKILSSAILSYGLVLLFERDFMVMLVKGTTVFFVSLIIYVILILIL
ncbi:MAG: Restriction endonuclease [Methanobacterium sp. PtaU1.Bin242]|nr:MAG: Restriction endonuclease [Methanobacterium sp. PtaU1.Bin242]